MSPCAPSLRSRIWLWCQPPGCFHRVWPNLPGHSRCTPSEAAHQLDIENLLMVRFANVPRPPFLREAAELSFARRLVWSVVGDRSTDSNNNGNADVEAVIALSHRFPNLEGGIMDDFFHAPDARGQISRAPLETVRGFRERLRSAFRPLALWCVVYDHDLDLPIAPFLKEVDVVTFWTWRPIRLPNLEFNLGRIRHHVGPNGRILLGCYLWNFAEDAPIPSQLLEHQLAVAQHYLTSNELEGVILLGSPLVDLPLESIRITRRWLSTLP